MTKSSISKFEAGDLVSITYLSNKDGGDIPRLVTKVNPPDASIEGVKTTTQNWSWTSYSLAPWHLNNRREYETNLKLVLAKNPGRVRCL